MKPESKGGDIRYYGQLFTNSGKTIPRAVQKAITSTQAFAELTLKANTPVDTGRLRASWNVMQTKKGLALTNVAPYAIYVEMGTKKMRARNMVGNSMPQISAHFESELKRNLAGSLAAKVRESTDLSYANLRSGSSFKNGLR